MSQYHVIKPENVRQFIIDELSDPVLKSDLQQNNNSLLNMLIKRLERNPMFIATQNKVGRFAFMAAFNCLNLRRNYERYNNKNTTRDLYLLHELHHIATLNHTPSGMNEWSEEHIRNEKASSLWSEALIFFAYPHLLQKFKQENNITQIWVDRFTNNQILLLPTESNQDFYTRDPKTFTALLFNEFLGLSEKSYDSLDEYELRTREYDLSTEMWLHKYKSNSANAAVLIQNYLDSYNNHTKDSEKNKLNQFIISHLESMTNMQGLFTEEKDFNLNLHDMQQQYGNHDKTTMYHLPFKSSLNGFLAHAVTRFKSQIENGDITNTKLVPVSITAIERYGITPTAYSLITNAAKSITTDIWGNGAKMYDMLYSLSIARTQDSINRRIGDTYKQWSSCVIDGWGSVEAKQFSFIPTAGANEAILHVFIRVKKEFSAISEQKNRLHIFAGEYEGAKIHAEAQGITVHTHEARDLSTIFNGVQIKHGDYFYISYPSAIDGLVWDDLQLFLDKAVIVGAKIILDATYIGASKFNNGQKIRIDSPAIEDFIWSFSKVFGLYYQRVGGMFNKRQPESAIGNLWFKNQNSLVIALNLMHYYKADAMPNRFTELQKSATQMANIKIRKDLVQHGLDPNLIKLQPCDVFMLANQQLDTEKYNKLPNELKALCRYAGNSMYNVRVCLTPVMEYIENVFPQIFRIFEEKSEISILDLGNTVLNKERYDLSGPVTGLSPHLKNTEKLQHRSKAKL